MTGAEGFVGLHLVKALEKVGAHVEPFKGDILSTLPTSNEFDFVFHLAAITDLKGSLENSMRTFEVNALGTLKLLENFTNIRKFVYVSTLGVYGEPQYVPIDENHPTRPVELYAASKLAGEAAVEGFCRAHDLPFAIARLFNVYGKGQRPDFVIPRLVGEITTKDEVEVRNPKSTRDFIFIDDVVSGLLALALRGKNDVYNIGTGKETSIKEVAMLIKRFTKRKVSLILQPESQDGSVKRSRADVRKANKVLGWSAKVKLVDGIKKIML